MFGRASDGYPRTLIAIAIALGLVLAGCRASPEVDALVTIVNRSTSTVTIATTEDGQAFEAFRSPFEACAIDRFGFGSGTVDIVVTSATDTGTLSFRSEGTASPVSRTIVIDTSGRIRIDSPGWPGAKKPC
jgi:hypothetical protein